MEDRHYVPEQNTAYRRGLVLGLTMAEVGILIIFILLLLIAFDLWRREGLELVEVEKLRALQRGESQLSQLSKVLQFTEDTKFEEIQILIRSLQESTVTPQGRSALEEANGALREMRRVLDQIKQKDDGSETLAQEVEKQGHRLANQEGQLRRYEAQLKEAGLGKGERPCWVRPDGTIEYLYDIVLASDGIRMREYQYTHRQRERSLLPMPVVDPAEMLTPAQFLRRTEPLFNHGLAKDCRFFVVVYDATGPAEKELYKGLLRTVEGHFFKRLDRGNAPF